MTLTNLLTAVALPLACGLLCAPAHAQFTQQGSKLVGTGAAGNAEQGYSVALSSDGNTAIVGGHFDNNNIGAAWIFTRANGAWTQQGSKLVGTGAVGNAQQGGSVAISGDGNTVIVGGAFDNINVGAAWVFTRSGGVWTQQGSKLVGTGAIGGAEQGISVALSSDGSTALLSGWIDNSNTGAVWVFTRSGGVWTQQGSKLVGTGATGSAYQGHSVSLSQDGNTALVGGYLDNTYAGAAWVFVRNGTTWSQQGSKLVGTGATGSAQQGYAVALSGDGNTAMVGGNDDSGNIGAAWIFTRNGAVWSQQGSKLVGTGDAPSVGVQQGYSVGISSDGNTAAIGGPADNFDTGAAWVFTRTGGVWTQQGSKLVGTGAVGSLVTQGRSLAMSGDSSTLMVGANYDNSQTGAVWVFAQPRIGTNALLVGSSGGSSSVVLSYGGAWTATANGSFLHIPAGSASGAGNAVVVFTYDAFTGPGTRTGTVTIAGLTVTVTQAGSNYIEPIAGQSPVVTLVSSGLNNPYGVAVDGSGNVYIADPHNSAIKEWSASTQQVATLASSGLSYPQGVAVGGSGNVYIADTNNSAIKEWSASTQQVTKLVSSGLSNPTGVAVDGFGDVYIADYGNSAIKEWSAPTQQVTTLMSSGLSNPAGAALDSSGNVYIADTNNSAIKEWSASTQQVTTLVSSGLSNPHGVVVDGSGNVYIADTNNSAIKEWSASTQQVTTLMSSGLNNPTGVAVDGSGNIYIADEVNNAIKQIPNAFVGPASLTEPATAGTDSLLPVLPSTASLTGVFAPASDSAWLTIGTVAGGVISFSFTANTSSSARTAHISVLGEQITVVQAAALSSVPVLTVAKTHAGNFTQGQNGASYTVTVGNAGTGPASGAVTVTETVPSGLSLVSMAGTGWTCAAVTCSRNDPLAAGSSYAAITVTVNVASNAPASVTNQVSVSGGGSATAGASDPTTIASGIPFFAGSVNGGGGTQFLQFPNGIVFGYYGFLGGGWMFHLDMGYEYVSPGNGPEVYLWDMASGHWWYTNTTTFPYLYDFTLKAWLYYFPDTKNVGHYTTNPRYFVNMTTGQILTM